MNKRGLRSKVEVADRVEWLGGDKKKSGITHEAGVIDGQVDTGCGGRGRAEKTKENRERCVVVKEKGRERWGRGKMRRI